MKKGKNGNIEYRMMQAGCAVPGRTNVRMACGATMVNARKVCGLLRPGTGALRVRGKQGSFCLLFAGCSYHLGSVFMSMPKIRLGGVLRVLALIVVVTIGWCFVRDRTSLENWHVPMDYNGDAPQILGWIEAASEGDYIPFWGETISRLGAPYYANWNDYPMYEKILTFGLGRVAKCFGVFVASNFGVLFGHILSAVSFYLCCRFMRYARTWSFVGAILFSFTYYHFFRGLGHLLLAYSYTVPWAILSCWIIVGSKRMKMGDKLSWVCLVTAAVMGLSNPYNLNVYVQLLCFAILAQFLWRRRQENLKVGLWSIAVAGAAFIAINMGTLTYEWAHGKNPAGMDRHYFEAELYALKPMEFFIPPPAHNVDALAAIGDKYISSAFVRGEICSAYLGIIGIAGLLWIFAEGFLLIVRNKKRTKPFPPHALQTVWIIFYSIIGGLNCIISLAGVQYFRGTDRYSIFISAIILLFLVSKMTVWSRNWSEGKTLGIAAATLALGIFDEIPRPIAPEETILSAKIIESDKAFGKAMEEKLPPRTMVFQMPVMSFPEAVPIHNVQGYEMLRPYFVTKTMRFAFGSVRGRNREAWQWEVEKLPAADMVSALERYGFGAIYINRKGYADNGEDLLKQLAAAGRTNTFEDPARQQVCVALKPSTLPELPHTDERAQILFKSGWAVKEHTPLENREWSSGDAMLSFFSESHTPATYNLRCLIGSISGRRVSIEMDGKEIWSGQIEPGQATPVDITVIGRHGNNKIYLKTDAKPVRPKDSNLWLAFTLVNLTITRVGN
jgi:phosphoglycerol transferase